MEDVRLKEFVAVSYGDGYGSGYGIKSIAGFMLNDIDGIPTAITSLRGNIAKGFILNGDLSLEPCYVVKQENIFAHGKTLREAQEALTEKLYEDMPEEERIAEFIKAHKADKRYSATDLFEWHHRLTGSCLQGREAYVRNRGIDMTASFTVAEFIELCENDYGGSTIRKLKSQIGVNK